MVAILDTIGDWLFNSFPNFLVCVVEYAVGLMRYMLIEVIQELLTLLWFVTLPFDQFLPDVLDQELPGVDSHILGYLNWAIPVSFYLELFTYVIGAFAVYRMLRWIANRIKVPIQPKLF